MALRNRWKHGEKEKMVAHYRRAKASDPKTTLATFAEAHYPDRTAKTLGQVIYELNKKAKIEAKAAGKSPAITATPTTSQMPTKAFSLLSKKRATADISSDDSDSDSDSSSNECIEDITFPGMRTPNKRIKSVYTTRSQTWLNKPEPPQDSGTTQTQTSEVPQRLDKATPMLSPRLRRATAMAPPTEHGNHNSPDPQPSASSMSPSQRHDTIPPPPPSKSPSPPPPPPSDPLPAASILPSPAPTSVVTAPPLIEEPEKEQIQNPNDEIPAASTGNTDDNESKQQQPETEATKDTSLKPEEVTTTVAHIRKVIAQQLVDFHYTNEQFNQANKKQYAEFSKTSEMLLALNQQSEKENLRLNSELSALQERYEAMQAEIENWGSERENLRSENAALMAKIKGIQQALQS